MIEHVSAASAAPSPARMAERLQASAAISATSLLGTLRAEPSAPAQAEGAARVEAPVEGQLSISNSMKAAENIVVRNLLDSLSDTSRFGGSFFLADEEATSGSFFARQYADV